MAQVKTHTYRHVHKYIQAHIHARLRIYPDSKVHGANMGPTWVLSAPDGPHVGRMNLTIRVYIQTNKIHKYTYIYIQQ